MKSDRNNFGRPSKHLLKKTVQIGDNPALRLCHKFEQSISPTIVSLDKSSFELMNTPFIQKKYRFEIAKNQQKKSESQY